MIFTSRKFARVALVCSIALSPLAQAQSTVSTYGLLDLSVGRFQAPGAAAVKGVESGKMTTSHLGFRGTEDLGDGMSAVFVLEHFLRADTGSAGRFDGDVFWARNAYVGLGSRSLGSVHAGRITTSLFVNTLRFNPFGDSFGFSPNIRHFFTSGTVTGDSAWSDSVRYASPTSGGAAFTAHVAAGESNGGRNAGLSGQYGSGPVALAAAWQKVEKGATVADTTTWQLSGSYDFKVVKVFAQYGKVDNDTTKNDYKIAQLGASVPAGDLGKVLMQWGQIDPKTGAKRTTISVGYDYNLSKRTDVYGVYMSDKLSGLSTGNNYGVGVRHRF
jgi:predicted porin